MATMNEAFKLYRLQQRDSKLDKAYHRLNEIAEILGDRSALDTAEAQEQARKQALDAAHKNLRKAETAVQDQRLKIKQTETKLYSGTVRNPKELQDLQNEAEALQRFLGVLEDRQLEAMIAVDEAKEAHQVAVTHLEAVKAKREKQRLKLSAEQEELQRQVAMLETERQATANTVSATSLQLYETLRKQRHGLAVAKISENACTACGSILSSQLLQEARSPQQISRCSACNRILYIG
ncbi:MAG: hypothetical protein AB1345_14310 [Chloroflexota bacterium]